MILAMILAHLVGDFILQSDRLAQWKSRSLNGVFVHGLIVLGVAWLFSLPFDPFWWPGVLFIGLAHTTIDAAQFFMKPATIPVLRFSVDQFLHFLTLYIALAFGGYMSYAQDALQLDAVQLGLLYAVAYAFLTMPTWVLLKFVGYWMIRGEAPVFPDTFNKYAGIIERLLIVTFVLTGQFLLVPVLAAARFVLEKKELADKESRPLYLFESLVGIVMAVAVGILLRQL